MTYDFSTDPDGLTREDFAHSRDDLLGVLRGLFIDDKPAAPGSFGVTVLVKGVVVSGLVVPAAEWGQQMSSDLERASGAGPALAGGLPSYFRATEERRDEFVQRREAEDRPVPDRGILCLKNAHVLSGGSVMPLGLTRILVEEIDGWSISQLTPPS